MHWCAHYLICFCLMHRVNRGGGLQDIVLTRNQVFIPHYCMACMPLHKLLQGLCQSPSSLPSCLQNASTFEFSLLMQAQGSSKPLTVKDLRKAWAREETSNLSFWDRMFSKAPKDKSVATAATTASSPVGEVLVEHPPAAPPDLVIPLWDPFKTPEQEILNLLIHGPSRLPLKVNVWPQNADVDPEVLHMLCLPVAFSLRLQNV